MKQSEFADLAIKVDTTEIDTTKTIVTPNCDCDNSSSNVCISDLSNMSEVYKNHHYGFVIEFPKIPPAQTDVEKFIEKVNKNIEARLLCRGTIIGNSLHYPKISTCKRFE